MPVACHCIKQSVDAAIGFLVGFINKSVGLESPFISLLVQQNFCSRLLYFSRWFWCNFI